MVLQMFKKNVAKQISSVTTFKKIMVKPPTQPDMTLVGFNTKIALNKRTHPPTPTINFGLTALILIRLEKSDSEFMFTHSCQQSNILLWWRCKVNYS